jgi:hypothetical protein
MDIDRCPGFVLFWHEFHIPGNSRRIPGQDILGIKAAPQVHHKKNIEVIHE